MKKPFMIREKGDRKMDWIEKLNQAVVYIEENLEGSVSYERAAQIACCSVFHFQRMFNYIAGIPLSEYIRRRRMTKAALELQDGKEKVIDLALKYGYQSPTAFNRAFQSVHGISPSGARKPGVSLQSYPPVSFKITVKGVTAMEYQIVKKEEMRLVGVSAPLEKEIEKNFETVPGLWNKATMDGTLEKLQSLMGKEPMGILGVSACFGESWRYYIAVATDGEVLPGMEEYIVPANTWAVFPGRGDMPGAIQELEKRAVTEWLPASGYEYADAPDIELYLDANPTDAAFEVWLPVTKGKK